MINLESPLAGMAQALALQDQQTPSPDARRKHCPGSAGDALFCYRRPRVNGPKGGPGVMATVNGHKN